MNKENTSIKILSLDGGGIKGSYVQLIILQEIEKICKIPIKNLFNFIIGTSAGAILGSNIAYDKPDEALREFNNTLNNVQNLCKKRNIYNLLCTGYRIPLNEFMNSRLLHNPCLNYYDRMPDYANLRNSIYIPYYCNIICKMIDNNWEPYFIRNYNIDNKICKKNNINYSNGVQMNSMQANLSLGLINSYLKK